MVNYVDRGAIASNGVNGSPRDCTQAGVCSHGSGIQGDFDLSNFKDGVISSAFMVGLLVASPIFASFSKSFNPFRLIGVGLSVWTFAAAIVEFQLIFGPSQPAEYESKPTPSQKLYIMVSSTWRQLVCDSLTKSKVQPDSYENDPQEEALKALQSMKQAFGLTNLNQQLFQSTSTSYRSSNGCYYVSLNLLKLNITTFSVSYIFGTVWDFLILDPILMQEQMQYLLLLLDTSGVFEWLYAF